MKKNVKKTIETEIKNVVYKLNNISLCRINNNIHLFGYQDLTINEVFEILVWGITNKIDDTNFWNIKLTSTDKQNAMPINIIYWMTGGNKIWKSHNWIWVSDWSKLSIVFLEHFDIKIKKILQNSKTLGELRNKIIKQLAIEDFYELGLKLDIINKDDILL